MARVLHFLLSCHTNQNLKIYKFMEKNKIMLIEDDPAIIDVYTIALKNAGIGAEFISWGAKAIEEVKKMQEGKREKPGLVLLDLFLPDINGVEILKEIKGNEKTKDILVYVTSNYTNEEFEKNSEVKPDKFILKSGITPTDLIKLIKKAISK